MHLYQLTLQRSNAINCAVHGSFSSPHVAEIVVAHGKAIELVRPDAEGKLLSVCHMECFGLIRSMATVRLPGANTDCVALGSDSGRLALVHYIPERHQFERIHLETYGKSGCRRTVAGQYMAADPAGRALMIAAIEKQRVVYTFDRDSNSLVSISPPIEAPRHGAITFAIAALDVGAKSNPLFASIDLAYSSVTEGDNTEPHKVLSFYEVDTSSKQAQVVKRASEAIDAASNLVIAVPGGAEGPGGVLVCAENKLAYMRAGGGGDEVVTLLPRRAGMPITQPLLITAHTVLRQSGNPTALLLQSELGDIYTVSFSMAANGVSGVSATYYDTLPVAIALVALGSSPGGRLFIAGEFSDHRLYQFLAPVAGLAADAVDMVQCEADGEQFQLPHFTPRGLRHLVQLDELRSLAPVLDLKCVDLAGEDAPQLYALCGRGPRSSLRTLRHGLGVAEMAVSELPFKAYAVWTVKAAAKDVHHKYILVGLANDACPTIVLSVGETVEMCTSVKFVTTARTITAGELGADMIVQVHQTGLHILKSGKELQHPLSKVQPGSVLGKNIKAAALVSHQVALILIDNSLLCLELNSKGELVPGKQPESGSKFECVALSPPAEGTQRSKWMAAGVFVDGAWSLFIFRVDAQGGGGGALRVESRMLLNGKPLSLCLSHATDGPWGGGEGVGEESPLVCFVGLENEMLIRVHVDSSSGQLSKDFRCRSLGARSRDDPAQPLKLFKVSAQGQPGVLALCSRPWLSYSHQGTTLMTPLAYDSIEYGAAFSSPQCAEGLVCVIGSTLRILAVHHFGEVFHQQTVRLAYTPRKCVGLKDSGAIIVIESDHNATKEVAKRHQMTSVPGQDPDHVDVEGEGYTPYQSFGVQREGEGKWASCIRVVDTVQQRSATKQVIELAEDEAAVSVCVCNFADRPNETLVLVGSVLGLKSSSRAVQGMVHCYSVTDRAHLTLVHKTPVDGIPRAMCAFQGRVLIGCDTALRLYDIGKKKLLHKCVNKKFSSWIQSVHVLGERIFVADATDSLSFVRYNSLTHDLECFASDSRPRWVTAACDLDYDTIAGGDKFGNVFVCRLSSDSADNTEQESNQDAGHSVGSGLSYDTQTATLPDWELCEEALFHVGETVTSVQKAKLVDGGAEAIIYTTIGGAIGAMQPFVKGRDANLLMRLEMHLRGAAGARERSDRYDHPSLCGTDQLAFRSSYLPVKDVIDGDLCETYVTLDPARQKQIADDLDRSPGEIAKKLEDLRNRLL